MVVQTRNAKKVEGNGDEVRQSEVEVVADTSGGSSSGAPAPLPPPPPPPQPLPMSRQLQTPPGSKASRSSSSSATVRAKTLFAEAQHARRLGELELQERQAQLDRELQERQAQLDRELQERRTELARQTEELEHRAKLAAIEAEGSVRSSRYSSRHSSHTRVSAWLDDVQLPNTVPVNNPDQTNNTSSHVQIIAPQKHVDVLSGPVGAVEAVNAAPARLAAPGAAAVACAAPTPVGAIETSFAAPTSGDNAVPVSSLISSLDRFFNNFNKAPKGSIINLPFFDGKSPIDYLSFKRTFLDTEASYTHAENLARLNYALRGVARDAVSVVLVSARVPADVLRLLDMRFGRPETIVLQEIAAMRSLPRVSGEGKEFAYFASRVHNCVEVIRLLNQSDHFTSPDLFNVMLSKLPALLRPRWHDYAAAAHADYGVKRLVTFANFLAREVELQVKYGIAELAIPTSSHVADARKFRDKVNAVSENINHSNSEKSRKVIRETSCEKSNKIICLNCDKNHDISDCVKFRGMSIPDRWQIVKSKKVCHRCLKKGWHRIKFCKSKDFCKINGCTYRHHSLLHDLNVERNSAAHVDVDEVEDSINECEAVNTAGKQTSDVVSHTVSTRGYESQLNHPVRSSPLLKIVAVTVSGPLGTYDTYALLDDGATSTFIDSEVSCHIGISGPKAQIHLDCVGGLSKETSVEYVDFHIKGKHGCKTYLVNRARSIKGLGIRSQSACRQDIAKLDHLSDLAHVLCYEEAKPTIIVGIDNWHLTLAKATRRGTKSQPVAIDTNLGWVLFGFSSSRTNPVEFVNHSNARESQCYDDGSLESLIREQYKLEVIGITKWQVRSSNDEHALKILAETTRRLPSRRFEVGLLWRSDVSEVPDSYPLALSRFLSLEKKMAKDPEYAKLYRENVHAMLQNGYAEECQGSPVGTLWYLPHFGVTNPNKPGKLRIVHDAAAKVGDVSLNSLLLPGPDFLRPLFGILFRFREREVAMTADIREMFPQVKIRVEDRDAQRFVYRDDPKEPIKKYRMSSMMFGATSSPSSALFVKNRNAEDFRHLYPDAAAAITDDHYMDDYIGSVGSVGEAAKLAADIVSVHKRAGFEMRGWVSNEPTALALLPKDLLLSPSVGDISLGDFPTVVRTLGLIWQPTSDVISFSPNMTDKSIFPKKLTKRMVLSYVMRVFDPLGILAPIVVPGRIMFQNIWRKGYKWDEELPEDEHNVWSWWFEDLALVSKLQIPRFYHTKGSQIQKCELHVFSDASELAFVAVAYWRFIDHDGNVKLTLICSKARVAPLKPISIPRLELQGALLAARLASSICEAHRYVPSKRFFWCDSLNVLGWLRSDARSYKPFVAHRIGEIRELTDVSEWRWVPTDLNVADDATRIKRGGLSANSRWVSGPQFLLSSEWPVEPSNIRQSSVELELKPAARIYASSRIHHTATNDSSSPHDHPIICHNDESQLHLPLCANPSRFSSWLRMVRATARAHQFLTLLRLRALRKRGDAVESIQLVRGKLLTFVARDGTFSCSNALNSRSLTADDVRLAEVHIFRQSQLDSFKNEMQCLLADKPVPTQSRLRKFVVFNGQDELIRLSDRTAAVADVEKVNPIILDGKHPAVRLLVLSYHIKAAHCNTELVVNQLRQRFWIIHARSVVRSITHHCTTCRLLRAAPLQPPVGDLPLERLSHHHRPFSFVGLDYFGPLLVAVGRRREKRWVAVLTCLVTRAIHLEVVFSLSTDAALMCLRRFIARRGTPSQIMSDNGTAFVGASRELKALYGAAVTDFAANHQVKWKFIPPSAPFMGGVWERMVRSVKTALRATLHERAPSDEVLQTLLAEAEFIVNSRPLTHVSCDAQSEEALTPLHFILGCYGGHSFPAELQDSDLVSRAGWRRALRMADHFWRRWVAEYLPTLAPRKSQRSTPAIAVGDLVLIADGNLSRGSWPRGRVCTVYPGRDGIVRVVDVCTSAGVLRRPTKKLVLL